MRRIVLGMLGPVVGLEGGLRYRGQPVAAHIARVFLEGVGYRILRKAGLQAGDLAFIEGIDSRQAALDLAGRRLLVDESDLPALEEGAYYYFQLIGQPVWVEDKQVGRVIEVEDAGAQDLLRLDLGQPHQPLVPLQAPYVRVVERGIEIDPVPGLLDP